MRCEGGIILDEKDIRKFGFSKKDLHQKILSYYQNRIRQGIEKYPVRVFLKRKAIEIRFVGRSVVDADVISLQDYLSLPILQILTESIAS